MSLFETPVRESVVGVDTPDSPIRRSRKRPASANYEEETAAAAEEEEEEEESAKRYSARAVAMTARPSILDHSTTESSPALPSASWVRRARC